MHPILNCQLELDFKLNLQLPLFLSVSVYYTPPALSCLQGYTSPRDYYHSSDHGYKHTKASEEKIEGTIAGTDEDVNGGSSGRCVEGFAE